MEDDLFVYVICSKTNSIGKIHKKTYLNLYHQNSICNSKNRKITFENCALWEIPSIIESYDKKLFDKKIFLFQRLVFESSKAMPYNQWITYLNRYNLSRLSLRCAKGVEYRTKVLLFNISKRHFYYLEPFIEKIFNKIKNYR